MISKERTCHLGISPYSRPNFFSISMDRRLIAIGIIKIATQFREIETGQLARFKYLSGLKRVVFRI